MKKFIYIPALLVLPLMWLSSCSDDSDPAVTQNIVEVAVDNGFNALATALVRTGLDQVLSADQGTYTVFAPTDAAFTALLSAIGQDLESVPDDVLTNILLYHVVPGAKVYSSEVAAGNVPTAISSAAIADKSITLSTNGGGVQVDGVSVVQADIEATNGIIHVIDQVIAPDDITQFVGTILQPAYFNKDFSILVAAASKANLVGAILDAEALTIFAPNNAAFNAAGIDESNIGQFSSEVLADIVAYHAVAGKALSTALNAGDELATLQGESLFVSITSDPKVYLNGTYNVVAADIEAGTGAIHVIDAVMMPPTQNVVEIALAANGADPAEFTSLVAALLRADSEGNAGLVNALSSAEGKFTVFAPTDAAFAQLLTDLQMASLNDIPIATLISVLQYHVLDSRVYSTDITNGASARSLQGGDLSVTINDDGVFLDESKVVSANINGTNGVIHVIDKVLLP